MNPLITDTVPACTPTSPVIVALDFAHETEALSFVHQHLNPNLCRLKIGKELFTASGRKLVEDLIMHGYDVFLDLKYHDIPTTVAKACKVAAQMGVWMVDLHVSGGRRMMEAAAEAISSLPHKPLLVGVTALTSMEEHDWTELGISGSLQERVVSWAQLAESSGLDGVVCSAREASALRKSVSQDFKLVTPGIRFSLGADDDDQRRTMTPDAALRAGASYLVIGRPITHADHPTRMVEMVSHLCSSMSAEPF